MSSTTLTGGFGEELRRWRSLRRVSQLELALRAGTTQRHLSFIERGRSVPGRPMVVRLTQSLELPLRERNALLLHAGYAPAYPEGSLDDSALRSVREALTGILEGHEPYPAMLIRRTGELLLANTACDIFFEQVPAALLVEPINTMRLALQPDGLAGRIVNFGAWAPHITRSLRRELARNPDAGLEALAVELDGYLAAEHLVDDDPLGFGVPMELSTSSGTVRLITTLTSFASASDIFLSELRLEAFLPADEETGERLAERAAGRARRAGPATLEPSTSLATTLQTER
jgi:transcriptional regulator with XRE-family HTH domain